MKESRIRFNVGGTTFHCYRRTLNTFPDTRLARLAESFDVDDSCDDDYDYDAINNEYFFDRNPAMFAHILEAYRTGILHLPRDVCGRTMREELEFWEISPQAISECCWKLFYKSENDIQTIKTLTQNYFRNTSLGHLLDSQRATFKMKMWLFLDEPRSSKYAMLWTGMVMIGVILSSVISALETVDALRIPQTDAGKKVMDRLIRMMDLNNSSDPDVKILNTRLMPVLAILDGVCFLFMSADVVLRIVTCPSMGAYLTNLLHIFEIVSVVDFWVTFALEWHIESIQSDHLLWFYLFCKMFVMLKLIRLFRLCRCFPALNIMGLSIRTGLKEIYALGAVLLILVVIFGYLVTSTEMLVNDNFENAFVAIYWAIITLTTVGYGDVYPTSPLGRAIASVCSVCGLIMLALPVGVIAANFSSLYAHHQYAEKHIRTYCIKSVGGADKSKRARNEHDT